MSTDIYHRLKIKERAETPVPGNFKWNSADFTDCPPVGSSISPFCGVRFFPAAG
jgi:hypothetical protein